MQTRRLALFFDKLNPPQCFWRINPMFGGGTFRFREQFKTLVIMQYLKADSCLSGKLACFKHFFGFSDLHNHSAQQESFAWSL